MQNANALAPAALRGEHIRPLPRFCWLVLGVFLLFLWVRAQLKWTDIAFFASCSAWCQRGRWDGVYDQGLNPLAAIDYPLSFFVLMYPVMLLPEWFYRAVWVTGIIAAWAALYRWMARGLASQAVGWLGATPTPALALVLGLAMGQRFLINDLQANQLNMIVFTVAVWALAWMAADRSARSVAAGATLLSLATGVKLLPILFLALLWLKRAWKPALLVSFGVPLVLWGLPLFTLGADTVAQLQAIKHAQKWGRGMWLMEPDSSELWSVANFLHYRIYVAPLFPGSDTLAPRTFQLLILGLVTGVGLPTLYWLLRRPWAKSGPRELWEDVSLIGVCWAIIDPIGRTGHFVTLVPALCLIVVRRIECWQQAKRPTRSEVLCYTVVVFTNLILIKAPGELSHHWYMHTGLFALGLFTLYGLTLLEVTRREREKSATTDIGPLETSPMPIGSAPNSPSQRAA